MTEDIQPQKPPPGSLDQVVRRHCPDLTALGTKDAGGNVRCYYCQKFPSEWLHPTNCEVQPNE